MTRFLASGAAILVLALPSCTLLSPTTGEEQTGLPTAVTAGIMRGMADDVELWDIDKDGLNSNQELVALGFAVAQRFLVAWQQLQVETGACLKLGHVHAYQRLAARKRCDLRREITGAPAWRRGISKSGRRHGRNDDCVLEGNGRR